MKKKQFGILLTISLSKDLYELVKVLSEQFEISMGEVVRNSIEHSFNHEGEWMASKPKPFTAENEERVSINFSGYSELVHDDGDDVVTDEEGQENVY